MKDSKKPKKEKKPKAEKQESKADYLKRLNPKGEPLTIKKYRELSDLQLSDEDAEQAVDSINELARVSLWVCHSTKQDTVPLQTLISQLQIDAEAPICSLEYPFL